MCGQNFLMQSGNTSLCIATLRRQENADGNGTNILSQPATALKTADRISKFISNFIY